MHLDVLFRISLKTALVKNQANSLENVYSIAKKFSKNKQFGWNYWNYWRNFQEMHDGTDEGICKVIANWNLKKA